MTKAVWAGMAAAVFVTATAVACGGGSSSTPTSPSTGGGGSTGGGSTSATATITIGSDGRVTPKSVTITRGGRVTMINNHNRPHDMESDPHPEHTQCPEINQIGFLNPGQSLTSGTFNTARSCGFHDHNEDTNADLKGTIVIQ